MIIEIKLSNRKGDITLLYLIIAVVIIFIAVGSILISRFQMKETTVYAIKRFKQCQVTDKQNAKILEELDLTPQLNFNRVQQKDYYMKAIQLIDSFRNC